MNETEGLRFRGGGRRSNPSLPILSHRSHVKTSSCNLVHHSIGFAAIATGILLLKLVTVINTKLPDQVKINEEFHQPDRFIGERAESYLKRLTELGTRVVGSYENEVLAVDLLKREISFIIQQAEPIHEISFDIQKPTGSYYLFLKPYGFRNYYANIQNLVVKIGPGDKSNHSLLVNCHYDTVPESPGASDNGLNCAVMLEVFRKLSNLKTPLPNNVIFLFNGAEENPLQASHGFITQHKWSKEVRAVINLDSAGAGGKEVLFQTSYKYPWLVKAYAESVPHPSGGVHGEELFQSGIIPSDTDFRVFRDFGPVPGLDLAHCDNGYIYHTKLDKMDYINPGVYQHTGDNILALVKKLISSPELSSIDAESESRVVYFDVFGIFFVVYTETFAMCMNIFLVMISIYSIFKTMSLISDKPPNELAKDLVITTGIQLFNWLISAAMVILVSKTLNVFNACLSWYSHPWYIIPLYAFPLIFTSTSVLVVINVLSKDKQNPGVKAIWYLCATQLLWTIVLLFGTISRIRTSFVIMLFVLFPTFGNICITFPKRMFSIKSFIITNIIFVFFPVAFILGQAARLFTTLIPMAGRMGPQANPELIMAALTVILGILAISYVIPLILVVDKPKIVIVTTCALHILSVVLITSTPLGFPYRGDLENPALQRFYVFHGERTFHNEKGEVRRSDSGYFVQALDRNNIQYVADIIPELQNARMAAPDCETELYCGIPIFTSRFVNPAPFSYWVPAGSPVIHHPTTLEVVSQSPIGVRSRRIKILITGPDHITVLMSPREDVNLLKWSFDEFEPKEGPRWKDRPTYMVYYSHGVVGATLEFDIDLEVLQKQPGSLIDFAVVGHYMHDQAFRTDDFQNFLSKFPDWAHLTPWTTTYTSWVV